MLCEKCRQRNAAVPTTNFFGGARPPEKPTLMELCMECFTEVDPNGAALMQTPCRYCGGRFACAGTLPPAEDEDDEGEQISMCVRCAREFHSFIDQRAPGIGKSLPTREQMKALVVASKQVDRHMKEWVSKGASDGAA